MDLQPATDPSDVLEYLQDEVPWEWERLESLDRLVSSWPDWAAPGSDPRQQTYSSWLRDTSGMFQTPNGLGGTARCRGLVPAACGYPER